MCSDRSGHPPRRLGGDPLPDHLPVLLQQALHELEHTVEELLVAVLRGDEQERLPDERGNLHPAPALDERVVEPGLHLLAGQDVGRAREPLGDLPGDAGGVDRLCRPAGDAPRELHPGQAALDDVAPQEVVLEEVPEAAPDPLLPRRDDRGVGDRDAERIPEQRRDGEPVGESTHHRRLGGGADPSEPRVARFVEAAGDEDEAHEHEQSRRAPLHDREALRLVGVVRGRGKRNVGHLGAYCSQLLDSVDRA
jgi:hypothetical protein